MAATRLGLIGKMISQQCIKAQPSYTPGLGFEIYGVTIAHIRPAACYRNSRWVTTRCWCRTFHAAARQAANPKVASSTATDKFYVEFQAQRPSWYLDDTDESKTEADPSFAVTAKLQTTANATLIDNMPSSASITRTTPVSKLFQQPGLPLSTDRFPDRD